MKIFSFLLAYLTFFILSFRGDAALGQNKFGIFDTVNFYQARGVAEILKSILDKGSIPELPKNEKWEVDFDPNMIHHFFIESTEDYYPYVTLHGKNSSDQKDFFFVFRRDEQFNKWVLSCAWTLDSNGFTNELSISSATDTLGSPPAVLDRKEEYFMVRGSEHVYVTSLGTQGVDKKVRWAVHDEAGELEVFSSIDNLLEHFRGQPLSVRAHGILVDYSYLSLLDIPMAMTKMNEFQISKFQNPEWRRTERAMLKQLFEESKKNNVSVWINTEIGGDKFKLLTKVDFEN
jgi:hypothetical protein